MILVASHCFASRPRIGSQFADFSGPRVEKVLGSLKTTVSLFEYRQKRLCLVATPFLTTSKKLCETIQDAVARELKIPVSNALICTSHDHCVPALDRSPLDCYLGPEEPETKWGLLPIGKEFLRDLRRTLSRLPDLLREVSVWYAVGREGRITYNRKGRRADRSTYFMREEDRRLIARDYKGDIDEDAPIVCLKGKDGRVVSFLVQFTGHPVTAFHPERPVAFGEWPQVACNVLARSCSSSREIPVSFLQGCCGDINSKEMFVGGVERSRQFGQYLGQTYVKASRKLKPSKRNDFDYAVEKVCVPLKQLPSEPTLLRETEEIKDFVRRARAGDEDTLGCVGLNFPRALSPGFRANMVESMLPWSRWALRMRKSGKAHTVPTHLEMEIYVLRLGDVGIVGLPCEPFMGIGRLIKKNTPLPLTIPCGYTNVSHGYIPDAPNTGDKEYMSAFYRWTRFRPQFRKPAGDVLAHKAIQVLRKLARGRENVE